MAIIKIKIFVLLFPASVYGAQVKFSKAGKMKTLYLNERKTERCKTRWKNQNSYQVNGLI